MWVQKLINVGTKKLKMNYVPTEIRGDFMKKRGRKPIGDPKCCTYKIRLTQKEYEKLNFCAHKKGKTMADILRQALVIAVNFDDFEG